ncbi:Uncharacterised protein [Elizabethkingia anophelis]|nr:Uncharacterised protein [Elizabethkingia anophelis]
MKKLNIILADFTHIKDKMKEIFKDYNHYVDWIEENYESTNKELTVFIEKNGLLMKRKCNLNGEDFRLLTKEEFELKNFINIPKL